MSKILTDAEFDKIALEMPLHHRIKLTVHNVLLQAALQAATQEAAAATVAGDDAATRDHIVAWLLEQCGDADTVRANHARKLALRIQAGEPFVNTGVSSAA